MYSYTISNSANKDIFECACRSIQTFLKKYKKEKQLQDVDGTTIQIYRRKNRKIKVVNDFEIDAVYVDSEIDLGKIFRKYPPKDEERILFLDDSIDIGAHPLPIISEDIRRLMEECVKEADGWNK